MAGKLYEIGGKYNLLMPNADERLRRERAWGNVNANTP